MEDLKIKIIEIIESYKLEEKSSTGTTGEKIIYSESFGDIAKDVCNLIQIVFDPENNPNQLGIKPPFEGDNSDFGKAVEPAIQYLFKNHSPHTKIYIDYSTAELLQGQKGHNLHNIVPD